MSPLNVREDLIAASLELVGTTFFLLLGLGGMQAVAAEKQSSISGVTTVEQVLYISTCMGFSLLVSAWLFFRSAHGHLICTLSSHMFLSITGSLFNPCITLALVLLGILSPIRGVLYFIAQFMGSILASAILLGLTGTLSVKWGHLPLNRPSRSNRYLST